MPEMSFGGSVDDTVAVGRIPGSLFHRGVVEKVLCSCTAVQHGSGSAGEKRAKVAAQMIVESSLPNSTDIYTLACRKRLSRYSNIQPAHYLLTPVHSGRRSESISECPVG